MTRLLRFARSTSALAAPLLLAAAAAAQTQQICFTNSIPLTTTNWNNSVTVSKFDPQLGTLQSIFFEITGHVTGTGRAESLDNLPTIVNIQFSSTMTLTRPDLSVIVIVIPLANFSDPLTAFDGTIDFGGTSGVTHPAINATQMNSSTSPPPPGDIALFTGLPGNPGTITLPVSAAGSSVASGPGNVISQFSQMAEATVRVCYTYQPNIPPSFVAPTPTCGTTLTGAVGSQTSFQVCAGDGQVGDTVTLTGTLPPGATTVPALPASGNPVCVTVNWTPTGAQVGTSNFSFTATDTHLRSANCGLSVNVPNLPPSFIAPTPTCGSTLVGATGSQTTFQVCAGDGQPGANITLTGTLPPGATTTPPLPAVGNPVCVTVNWTPTGAQVGTSSFSFTAVDAQQRTANCGLDVSVPNIPPSFQPPTPACGSTLQGATGSLTSFQVCVGDGQPGDNITLTGNLPAGATTVPPLPAVGNPVCVTVNWTPTGAQIGTSSFSFTAVDSHQRTANCGLDVNVPNVPPTFNAPTPTCGSTLTADSGNPFSFQVCAGDGQSGDVITLTGTLPPGATTTPPLPAQGNRVCVTVNWTPTGADVGTNPFSFTATDLQLRTANCGIDVFVPNLPPAFLPPTPTCGATLAASTGSLLQFDVCAGDGQPGDVITLTGNLPPGATTNPALPAVGNPVCVTVSWVPNGADVGTSNFSFTATDAHQRSATCGGSITVPNVGPTFQPPTPACGSVLMATSDVPMSFQVCVGDGQAGDVITLNGTLPAGATTVPPLPAQGNPVCVTVNWTPTLAQLGTSSFQFTAIDTHQRTAACSLSVLTAECYQFLGRGGGGSDVLIGGTPFHTQMDSVRSLFPVTMVDRPHFRIPILASGQIQFSFETVMHNPFVFPNNPDQWSQRLRVSILPGGVVQGQLFGTLNGIHQQLQTFTDPNGDLFMSFPFTIDGM